MHLKVRPLLFEVNGVLCDHCIQCRCSSVLQEGNNRVLQELNRVDVVLALSLGGAKGSLNDASSGASSLLANQLLLHQQEKQAA